MSIKYIAINPTRLVRIQPPTTAKNSEFSNQNDLNKKHADLVAKSIRGCSPISSQGSSTDAQAQCKSSDSNVPAHQSASSNPNGSIKALSLNTSAVKSNGTVLVVNPNGSITALSLNTNAVKSNGTALVVNPNESIETNVVSVKNSSNSKTEETSDFISVGSEVTPSDSDDSSPSKMAPGENSTEDGGFNDVESMETDTEPKVVVQVLSNVGCEIPPESDLERRWNAEEMVNFIKQSDEQSKNNGIVDGEWQFDNCHRDNLSSQAGLSNGRMRRNHAMNLHIRSGNGVRLKEIAHIVSRVENASPSLLYFLHKTLFGSNRASNNEDSLSQTKQNILHFSGFPFTQESETFRTKRVFLLKLPYQLLNSLCQILLGKGTRTRNDSVEDLLNFMLKPTNNSMEKEQLKTNHKECVGISDRETQELTGPLPIVLVEKLKDSFIKDLLLEFKQDSLPNNFNEDVMDKDEKSPEPTSVTGITAHKTQLKSIPEVVQRVKKARRRIINLLHILLYGRTGCSDEHRSNILEFEGFTDSEKNFRRKSEFLKKLKIDELNQLCLIFSMRVKKRTKLEKAIKFLHCLQTTEIEKRYKKGKTDPREQSKRTFAKKRIPYSEGKTDPPEHNKITFSKKRIPYSGGKDDPREQNKRTFAKKRIPYTEVKREYVKRIKKLKDFENIRRNIECAPPEELIELSDLLFLRPSDNLEIHQRILEFPSSSFRENSPDFYSRRTLLDYMTFDIIRKIASILEITDWEEYRHPQDLGDTLLRFLIDMKPSVNIRPQNKYSGLRRQGSSSVIHRPHLTRLQKDYSYQDHNFNRNQHQSFSETPNSAYMEDFQEEKGAENSSVVIRRITESSYSFTDLKNNEPVTVSECKSEESHSLYTFVQHPSKKQLEVTIKEIIGDTSWSSTMGELINKVFHYYPKFDLTYRTDFIKSKAIEVLHELQS